MMPGERLDLIKAIRPRLAALEDEHEIFMHLAEFHPSTAEFGYWADEHQDNDVGRWLVSALRECTDDELFALHGYFVGSASPPDSRYLNWRQGRFRLFLSHVVSNGSVVADLAAWLDRYGVHAFVAHSQIQPGHEWTAAMRSYLQSCDALVAVLHDGFHLSDWTDQEIGFVLGRGKFAVAVRAGLDPYGFLASVQGVAAPGLDPANYQGPTALAAAARGIAHALVSERTTQVAMRDALVIRLVESSSFSMSNDVIDLLRQCPPISESQYRRLRAAQVENEEVGHAFNVPDYLDSFAAQYEVEAATAVTYPPEPF